MGKSFSRLSPRIINTLFLCFLQNYFRNHVEYVWNPDASLTQIDIAPEYAEDDNLQKGMPLIVVENGPTMVSPAGFNGGTDRVFNQLGYVNGKLIEKEYIWDMKQQFNINSSTSIHVHSPNKDDADELAYEVAIAIELCRPLIANILQIQNISDAQISPAAKTGQTGWNSQFMAMVSFSYSYTLARMWQPVDSGELLKSIETVLTPVNGGTTPKPGDKDEKGNDINIGNVGGTNSGGQNGNWGGTGGVSSDYTADGIDDNVVNLRFKVAKDSTKGYQPGEPET